MEKVFIMGLIFDNGIRFRGELIPISFVRSVQG